MLSLKNVRFEILRDPIVRDFSMDLQPGEVKTLFGPSGCGKTTVLRLISGLETPKSGEINNTFRKNGLSVSRKSSIRKSHCHAEYCHFLWIILMKMKSLR